MHGCAAASDAQPVTADRQRRAALSARLRAILDRLPTIFGERLPLTSSSPPCARRPPTGSRVWRMPRPVLACAPRSPSSKLWAASSRSRSMATRSVYAASAARRRRPRTTRRLPPGRGACRGGRLPPARVLRRTTTRAVSSRSISPQADLAPASSTGRQPRHVQRPLVEVFRSGSRSPTAARVERHPAALP
jgi:hypothetical protein